MEVPKTETSYQEKQINRFIDRFKKGEMSYATLRNLLNGLLWLTSAEIDAMLERYGIKEG